MGRKIPEWVTYPEDDWIAITTAEAGLDVEKFDRFLSGLDIKGASFGGEDHNGTKWGTVLTRGGLPGARMGRPALPVPDGFDGQGVYVGADRVFGGRGDAASR